MNLVLMRYCEGMELVTQVVTDSSYEFLLISEYHGRFRDVSGYSLISKRHRRSSYMYLYIHIPPRMRIYFSFFLFTSGFYIKGNVGV